MNGAWAAGLDRQDSSGASGGSQTLGQPLSGTCTFFGLGDSGCSTPLEGNVTHPVSLFCLTPEQDSYYDDHYTDQELVSVARTALNAMSFAGGGPSYASVVFDEFSSTEGPDREHTSIYLTDFQYTITTSAGGSCSWTVRYTDLDGSVTETPMTGSGTFTILGESRLTFDADGNYATGAGTVEIITSF